ncbi:AdoMet-dependent rRNA methyltransferase spb-1 [Xylariaceae sp. FL0804]|nr:AdoMet-dependent rRNA methyltransferase spb-1 [Xylariaceae sp. FL0804]
MGFQKKTGKGRLDKWYKLAKEKGYRARAAFKLIQLNKKFSFLEQSRVLIDLCAAPGSWLQVAAEAMPQGSLLLGVDLSPIKPIPNVITFQSDITTDKCRATLRQHMKTWKADTVLHDGAPNVGTSWLQDSFNQAELVLQSMKLATEFLVEGGTFVTKVFRSKEYNKLLWVFQQLFSKVESTKPPSSRNVSAEIFVVCRGFKAPKHLDPKFLDPRSVFAEYGESTDNNNEAKVFNPEIKKRKRGGYEEGDWTQFKEIAASDFVEAVDPIAILANYNKLTFEQPRNGNISLAALDKMPETTEEIRIYCSDLKVLGRRDFKVLLKWRLKAREAFGLPTKKTSVPAAVVPEEVAEVESMDEELKIQEELQALRDKDSAKKKRERRRENEKKQREIKRMQLHMVAPMDIGIEGASVQDGMFALKPLDKKEMTGKVAKGRMAVLSEKEARKDQDSGIGSSGDTDDETDEEEDRLERELDGLYDQYKERKADYAAKVKKAKRDNEDGEWEGVSADEQESSDEDGHFEEDSSSDDSDVEDQAPSKKLLTDLDNTPAPSGGLSKRATSFFNQDIFKGIPGLDDATGVDSPEDNEEIVEDVGDLGLSAESETRPKKSEKRLKGKKMEQPKVAVDAPSSDSDGGDQGDQGDVEMGENEDDDWDQDDKRRPGGRPDIDIITAEAMTLAHQLATGQKSNYDVVDDGFNKHAFRDRDGLPEWFLDDETRHDKQQKPITKAAAAAIKEKTRALNARPIKKVREAQARKKFKAAQRLEKIRKKSDLLANEEGMTEKEKASSIGKLLARAARKNKPQRQPAKLVVAKGLNRGVKGRPKGVKGRYKIVDPRMKKELRAEKRIAKKKKR